MVSANKLWIVFVALVLSASLPVAAHADDSTTAKPPGGTAAKGAKAGKATASPYPGLPGNAGKNFDSALGIMEEYGDSRTAGRIRGWAKADHISTGEVDDDDRADTTMLTGNTVYNEKKVVLPLGDRALDPALSIHRRLVISFAVTLIHETEHTLQKVLPDGSGQLNWYSDREELERQAYQTGFAALARWIEREEENQDTESLEARAKSAARMFSLTSAFKEVFDKYTKKTASGPAPFEAEFGAIDWSKVFGKKLTNKQVEDRIRILEGHMNVRIDEWLKEKIRKAKLDADAKKYGDILPPLSSFPPISMGDKISAGKLLKHGRRIDRKLDSPKIAREPVAAPRASPPAGTYMLSIPGGTRR